jgi:putative DNA primase/helicase
VTLIETLIAAGMTPPRELPPGRFVRFPGRGKKRSNRAGWCRLITPTLAVWGDWSTGEVASWRDAAHRDAGDDERQLAQARRESELRRAERYARQREAQALACRLIGEAREEPHPYLARKGFAMHTGLVLEGKLLVPVRDAHCYGDPISVQMIDAQGDKRFLPGGRTKGGIYRIGVEPRNTRRLVLCEGYATGLSLDMALCRLPGPHTVIVCFSAGNLEVVAERFPKAFVCADNDESKTGEIAALRTGLRWVMPPTVGQDFNDYHQAHGIYALTQFLRQALP